MQLEAVVEIFSFSNPKFIVDSLCEENITTDL